MSEQTIKLSVFYCANSVDHELLKACGNGIGGATVRTISIPCSGKVDIPYFIKAFETGADAVAIITCKISECRHIEGNLRANKRAEAVDSLLEEIGAGRGRMAVIHLDDSGAEGALKKLTNFVESIKTGARC